MCEFEPFIVETFGRAASDENFEQHYGIER